MISLLIELSSLLIISKSISCERTIVTTSLSAITVALLGSSLRSAISQKMSPSVSFAV